MITIIRINKELNIPMYKQIINSVIEDISADRLKHMEKLPSEEDVSTIFAVSAIVVKDAYKYLLKKGYIFRKRGEGTFAINLPKLNLDCRDILYLKSSLDFSNYKKELILKTLSQQDESAAVAQAKLLYYHQGYCFCCQNTYIYEGIYDNFVIDEDIYLKIKNCEATKDCVIENTLSPRLASSHEATLLKIEKDDAIMLKETSIFHKSRLVAQIDTVFRGDMLSVNI